MPFCLHDEHFFSLDRCRFCNKYSFDRANKVQVQASFFPLFLSSLLFPFFLSEASFLQRSDLLSLSLPLSLFLLQSSPSLSRRPARDQSHSLSHFFSPSVPAQTKSLFAAADKQASTLRRCPRAPPPLSLSVQTGPHSHLCVVCVVDLQSSLALDRKVTLALHVFYRLFPSVLVGCVTEGPLL